MNGFGTSATMAASGSQDVDDQDLTLGVFGAAPSQFGLFFYGPVPGLDAPRQRHALRRRQHQPPPGDRHRALRRRAAALGFGSLPAPIANGDVWNFQFWYRDVVGSGSNLSDGLQITFCAAP